MICSGSLRRRQLSFRLASIPLPYPATAQIALEAHLGPIFSSHHPAFVRTHDATAFLGLFGRTLEKHRCTGTGPVFRKLGGRVVYAIEDLETWAAERARNSTSDPGRQASARGVLVPRPR